MWETVRWLTYFTYSSSLRSSEEYVRLKQCEFSALFGWWSADQLLRKHGIESESEDSDVSDSSDMSSFSVYDLSILAGVSDTDILALFASDVEDDSDMDDEVEL